MLGFGSACADSAGTADAQVKVFAEAIAVALANAFDGLSSAVAEAVSVSFSDAVAQVRLKLWLSSSPF